MSSNYLIFSAPCSLLGLLIFVLSNSLFFALAQGLLRDPLPAYHIDYVCGLSCLKLQPACSFAVGVESVSTFWWTGPELVQKEGIGIWECPPYLFIYWVSTTRLALSLLLSVF